MKAFVELQLGYCPLKWMFHGKGLNNKINRVHKRALRITYKEKSSTFQELLEKDNSVSIHHRNVRKLATETYKILHGFSPLILNYIFVPISRPYNFREMTHYKGEEEIPSDMAQNPFHFLDKRYGIFYPVILNYHNL